MCEIEKVIGLCGDIYWYKKGTIILHREDGPAVEWADGGKYWYQNNQLHRLDGPACEYADGGKKYYIYGKSIGYFGAELIKYTESYLINV